jgi:response regulator RpfG family c-di-GMP phosphodiesterase
MSTAKKRTLLVVDDEPDVCQSVADLLRRDFRVLQATSAAEGARIMQENDVNIIITDQRMPQISGVEFLTRAKTNYPHAIRMLFTGYADLDAIIAAINQGHIFRFIKKPWQPEELEAAVREAAAEYDVIVHQEEELKRLNDEVIQLRERVTALESEVRRLQKS